MRILALLTAFLMVLPVVSHAQEADGLKLPPPGTTVLNLSATETQKVAQDMIVASLRIDVEAKDAKEVQAKINLAMQNAITRTKKEADVKTTTGTYSVYPYDQQPIYDKNGNVISHKEKSWRGQQTIEMKSLNADIVLKLTGELQEMGFVMNNLGYALSPEKYESVQDALLVKALAKLTAKADLASKTLKKSGYDMLNVDLNAGGFQPPMMYARAEMAMGVAMDKSMPAPVVAAGDTDVSLTVSARVLLKP